STNIPKDIPVIGHFLSRLALGGENISGSTLTRFYAIHVVLLPALLVAFIGFHIYLVRVHGISEHTEEEDSKNEPEKEPAVESTPARVYRFYPEHAWRSSLVFAFVFLVLISLSTPERQTRR